MNNTPTEEKDIETQTEEIVQSMMYVSDKIDILNKEIASYRDILQKYKTALQKLHPDESVDIVEFLTKRKILERSELSESSGTNQSNS